MMRSATCCSADYFEDAKVKFVIWTKIIHEQWALNSFYWAVFRRRVEINLRKSKIHYIMMIIDMENAFSSLQIAFSSMPFSGIRWSWQSGKRFFDSWFWSFAKHLLMNLIEPNLVWIFGYHLCIWFYNFFEKMCFNKIPKK
jgi:hypothetical protein